MNLTVLTGWAAAHQIPAAAAVLVVLLALAGAVRAAARRTTLPPGAVLVAALAAATCTAYSADTSWRFAEHTLHMDRTGERAAMFAAGELALLACALMARQNLRQSGTPGTPGMLVWVITGVQVIPAYSESGMVGGTVRAILGPVLAALLWHIAMGIELRHTDEEAESTGLVAVIGRELRERLLSRLGLATRGRDAEQISRDRATDRAVQLAARLAANPKERTKKRIERRLAVAVARAHVGEDEPQRQRLMDLLAARRNAAGLATVPLTAPWEPKVVPPPASVSLERIPVPVPVLLAIPPVPPPATQEVPSPVPPVPDAPAKAEPETDPVPPAPTDPEPPQDAPDTKTAEPPDTPKPDSPPPVPTREPLEPLKVATEPPRVHAATPPPALRVHERVRKEPEPAGPTAGTSRKRTGTAPGTNGTRKTPEAEPVRSFDEHVALARNWLTANPELSGTQIGTRLGKSGSYGRRVRRAATA